MTYELINTVTTNTIAAFDTEREAVDAFRELRADNQAFAADLAIVAFDEDGEAVEAHPAVERATSYA